MDSSEVELCCPDIQPQFLCWLRKRKEVIGSKFGIVLNPSSTSKNINLISNKSCQVGLCGSFFYMFSLEIKSEENR